MPDFLFFLPPHPNFPRQPDTRCTSPGNHTESHSKGRRFRKRTNCGAKRRETRHETSRFASWNGSFYDARQAVSHCKTTRFQIETQRPQKATNRQAGRSPQQRLQPKGAAWLTVLRPLHQYAKARRPATRFRFWTSRPDIQPTAAPRASPGTVFPCRKRPKRLLSCRGASPRTTGGGR